jgi:hypothetical protein
MPRASPAYIVEPLSHCYEQIFLEVFQKFACRTGSKIEFTSRRKHVTAFRAMRRKSGLKMIDADGHVTACLKSEYREIFCVFVLEWTGPDGLRNLMTTMEEYGLRLEYNHAELDRSLQPLAKQYTAEAEG